MANETFRLLNEGRGKEALNLPGGPAIPAAVAYPTPPGLPAGSTSLNVWANTGPGQIVFV